MHPCGHKDTMQQHGAEQMTTPLTQHQMENFTVNLANKTTQFKGVAFKNVDIEIVLNVEQGQRGLKLRSKSLPHLFKTLQVVK